jgi:hypothetical protein
MAQLFWFPLRLPSYALQTPSFPQHRQLKHETVLNNTVQGYFVPFNIQKKGLEFCPVKKSIFQTIF